jgi:hypothetical protein
MKIQGPGPSLPPEGAPAPDEASEAKRAADKGFAAAIDRAATPAGASRAAEPTAVGPVADIAADLRAGKLTPQAALEQVIERILDHQVGATAPPALRAQVATALRQALEDDPVLAAKLRTLGG